MYTFSAPLWRYPGHAAWYFVTLPAKYTEELKAFHGGRVKGFGSIKVEAKIGSSTWHTSIFPDSKSGCFMLPVKKDVRQHNSLEDGDEVQVTISLAENF